MIIMNYIAQINAHSGDNDLKILMEKRGRLI